MKIERGKLIAILLLFVCSGIAEGSDSDSAGQSVCYAD